MIGCEYRHFTPGDNHSDDLVEVYHGAEKPLVVCGFHEASVDLHRLIERIGRDRAYAESGGCGTCMRYGCWFCRESSGVCDHCGTYADVFMDYAESGDREKPDQTLCLDCIAKKGQHFQAAHPTEEAPNE